MLDIMPEYLTVSGYKEGNACNLNWVIDASVRHYFFVISLDFITAQTMVQMQR